MQNPKHRFFKKTIHDFFYVDCLMMNGTLEMLEKNSVLGINGAQKVQKWK